MCDVDCKKMMGKVKLQDFLIIILSLGEVM